MRLPAGRPAKWLVAVLVHTAATQLLTLLVRPTISYRALELGVPSAWLGAIASAFALIPLLAAVLVGRVVDRSRAWPALCAGAAIVLLGCGCLWLIAGSVQGLVAASAVLGLGHLIASVGQQSAIARFAEPDQRVAIFAHYGLAASAGQAAGPLVASLASGNGPAPATRQMFLVAVAVAGLLLAWTVAIRVTPDPRPLPVPATQRRLTEALRTPSLGRAILISISVLSAVDLLVIYLPALGAERGWSATTVNLLLTARAGAAIASRLLLGGVMRRLGRRVTLTSSLLLSSLSVAVASAPLPMLIVVVALIAAGLGLGVGQPVSMAWISEAAPERHRATALSIRLAGNRLGQTVLPVAVGVAASTAGTPGVFAVIAAWLALASGTAR